MSDGVILQDIRNFVVQIRHISTDDKVGTGFVVKEGIITCVHVIRDAGIDPRAPEGEVGVYYPEREGRPSVHRRAGVRDCFPEHDDDVVLLKLIDGPSPLPPELVAKLGTAKDSRLHEFQSFGYRKLNNYQGLPAYGKIVDFGEKPEDKKLQGEPLMLSSQHIDEGMSGAPVLDVQRNLIIGVIYLAWDSARASFDRDTGFAVDAKVLSIEPIGLSLQEQDLPKALAPTPKVDVHEARARVASQLKKLWNNAPTSLKEWIGRAKLLDDMNSDWMNPDIHITGLIGFGGEGKSSLARQWIDNLVANSSIPKPDGIFWWGFYEKRNAEEFFDAALHYLSGGMIDSSKIPSANLRAQIIGAMLGAGRYLFVMDGLEVLQYQDGDMYGSLRSPDLKAFLEFFAAPGHDSFCLVTSRAPLQDLTRYITYRQREVNRLSPEDGRDLLRHLGVRGKDEELDRVVGDWDGHALTLSLLASYLQDHHEGDIGHIRDIPPPTAKEPRYERVHRVLRRYNEHLTDAERAFLKLFSVFRMPVDEDAFDKIFRAQPKGSTRFRDHLPQSESKPLNASIAMLSEGQFEAMVKRLLSYRILRLEPETARYTAHPLVRAHYYTRLIQEHGGSEAHLQLKDYYLARAQDMPDLPCLEDLTPIIEAVHHACQCGDYDAAIGILWERIERGNEAYLTIKLGAWETSLEIAQEFFPRGDISLEIQVSSKRCKSWILNSIGLCLATLCRGDKAESFFQRSQRIDLDSQHWRNASVTYQNLSELYWLRGELDRSMQATKEALKLARRAEDKAGERTSLVLLAWALHLQGDIKRASRTFQKAEALERQIDSSKLYLYGLWGTYHADHLRRAADVDQARRVTEANLKICERYQWINDILYCRRLLGDLCAQADQPDSASEHYRRALVIARSISHKLALVEALQARGRWEACRLQDPNAAFNDLKEALDYACAGGYRIFEADIRVGLAWAHLAAGDRAAAREEAIYAKQMSEAMGYYWGKVDADEVSARISE